MPDKYIISTVLLSGDREDLEHISRASMWISEDDVLLVYADDKSIKLWSDGAFGRCGGGNRVRFVPVKTLFSRIEADDLMLAALYGCSDFAEDNESDDELFSRIKADDPILAALYRCPDFVDSDQYDERPRIDKREVVLFITGLQENFDCLMDIGAHNVAAMVIRLLLPFDNHKMIDGCGMLSGRKILSSYNYARDNLSYSEHIDIDECLISNDVHRIAFACAKQTIDEDGEQTLNYVESLDNESALLFDTFVTHVFKEIEDPCDTDTPWPKLIKNCSERTDVIINKWRCAQKFSTKNRAGEPQRLFSEMDINAIKYGEYDAMKSSENNILLSVSGFDAAATLGMSLSIREALGDKFVAFKPSYSVPARCSNYIDTVSTLIADNKQTERLHGCAVERMDIVNEDKTPITESQLSAPAPLASKRQSATSIDEMMGEEVFIISAPITEQRDTQESAGARILPYIKQAGEYNACTTDQEKDPTSAKVPRLSSGDNCSLFSGLPSHSLSDTSGTQSSSQLHDINIP